MEKIKVKTTRCPVCNSAKTYMRIKKSFGIVCYNCGKFTAKEKEDKENIISSAEKCPSCGGIIKNGECQTCHARKFQKMFVYEKEKEIKEENKQKGQKERPENYICESCGEKVKIRGNIKRSWWDGVEWVECPECGEMKKREEIYDK